MLSVRFWGTRGSVPTPGASTVRYGGNTPCIELVHQEDIVVFDSGTGIRALGDDLIDRFGSRSLTVHLFLSHTHWDHIHGFPFFRPAYSRGNRIVIYGPPASAARAGAALTALMDAAYCPVSLASLSADVSFREFGDGVVCGSVTVECCPLNHPGGCVAYRATAGRRRVVYATDHEPFADDSQEQRRFLKFLSGADLYIGDAQYTQDEYDRRRGWGHSPLGATVQTALQADVGALALFHHDPAHDDAFLERMAEQATSIVRTHRGVGWCSPSRERSTWCPPEETTPPGS